MQSPSIENSNNSFSCQKQNLVKIFEFSLENKENFASKISNKNQSNSQVESENKFDLENPQKNCKIIMNRNSQLDNLLGNLKEEIEELIKNIEAFNYFDSIKNAENVDSPSACENLEVNENFEEKHLLQNLNTNELISSTNNSNDFLKENDNYLSNYLDSQNGNSYNIVDKKNSSENNGDNLAINENEFSNKITKREYLSTLKHYFKTLFNKMEKLLEAHNEANFLNFTETDFQTNSHTIENKNNNTKINNSNYNDNNYTKHHINETDILFSDWTSYINQLLTKITKISIEKKFLCNLMNFHLKTGNESIALDIFKTKNIVHFHDYEEAIFSLAEDLTRNLSKIEMLFQILQFSSQNFVFSLYPVFSVCMHKLVKSNFIQQAFILKNYMLHFKLEISSLAINSLLEALGKNSRIEEASNLIKEIENTKFVHFLNCFNAEANTDIYIKNNFSKISQQTGLNQISYGILIKHLCKNSLIDTALVHYENLKNKRLIKDEVIFNLLIDGCSKSSNLAYIMGIYQDMIDLEIKPSIVTFNSIIDSYVRAKDLFSAWKIYEDIKNFDCVADNFTFSTLFRGIRSSMHKEYLEKAFLILEEINKSNNSIDVILINVLIDSCICLKDEYSLRKIFCNAVNGYYKNLSPDIISFNTFIKGCAQLNLYEDATNAFNILISKQDQIAPNDVSFNTMIDVYVRSENLNKIWDLLELMKKYGIKPDNFTYSTIIKGINKKSNFNNYNNSNINIDNDDAELEMAFKLFENVKSNSKPDEILYNCIMDACLRFEKINKMMEYHQEMIRDNVKPSSITCGILIKAYGMTGMVDKAFEIYENMKSENIEISSITYGCLINACIKNNNLQKSFELYQELDENNIEMNTVLYTTMIKAYSKKNNLHKVIEIFEKMKKDKNNKPNNVTYNSVIDCCIKCNNMREAENKFADMKLNKIKPDIITYSTLIKGCLKSSMLEKAIDYLHTMINLGIKPDEVLLNSLLDGCEKMSKFTQARDIFLFVRKFGVQPSMMSFSIMMKIYGKLKDFQNSKILLEEVKTKPKNCSLIIFTCFIKTCLQTKNFQEALITYESLTSLGIQPDQITFSTILKGLVINRAYHFIPKIINDSLLNQKTVCSNAIYSEALNALNNNLSKTKLTQSDLFEIRRNLAFNNIFVEISNNENCYSNANLNKNTTRKDFKLNDNFAKSNFSIENNNTNFYENSSNKEGKNFRGNYKNQDSFFSNSKANETYVDNFDFLIKGYKNNKKHYINNSANTNHNLYQQSNNCDNFSNKKGINNETFNKKINQSTLENERRIMRSNQNSSLIHNQIVDNFSNIDENSFFDKPSSNVSVIPKASVIENLHEQKSSENNYANQPTNLTDLNPPEEKSKKLKERSSYYKNFGNSNGISNYANNSNQGKTNQILKDFNMLNKEKTIQNDSLKINIKTDLPGDLETNKENIKVENYYPDQNWKNQAKNMHNPNYSYNAKGGLKHISNTFENNNFTNSYTNNSNAKNIIFRKGFNMPIDSNIDKIANASSKFSLIQNDENSNYNLEPVRKSDRKGNNNHLKTGNNFLADSSYNQQPASKLAKKLTRF